MQTRFEVRYFTHNVKEQVELLLCFIRHCANKFYEEVDLSPPPGSTTLVGPGRFLVS
jgi:hypothetical protein